jgi:predicted kinase
VSEVARPTLVVVSGPPRTGKTTLARTIAQAIPCPVVSRDEIKEGMVHAHGEGFEAASGDPLTQRTFPLFFDVVRLLLTEGVTMVAEAAFQDPLWRRGLEPLQDLAHLRVVQCTVDAAVAFRRYSLREAHAVITGTEPEDWTRAFDSFNRISIAAPSIEVDTRDGYTPEVPEIVEFINRR